VITVLIVEDEPLIAEAHRAYLGRLQGFSVAAVAHTARDAMRAASEAVAGEAPIDLVLLDIGLPDANGIALASALSGLRPAPDIIAITSERDLEMVRAAVGHGALAYLLKPFTFAAFRDKLERYAAYRILAEKGGEAGQPEIDAMLGELRTPGSAPLPKGLSKETLDLVARTLKLAPEALGAAETAEEAGLSRVTARRYLEHLVLTGQAELELRYGGSGRPEHRYRWTPR
jgi:response regulator of citrate/malate metabolism